jgi:hypothetical protein
MIFSLFFQLLFWLWGGGLGLALLLFLAEVFLTPTRIDFIVKTYAEKK